MEHDGQSDIRLIGGARRAAVEVRTGYGRSGPRHFATGWILAAAPHGDGTLDFAIEPAVWRWYEDGEQRFVPPMRAPVRSLHRPARGQYDPATGEVFPAVDDAGLSSYDPRQLREMLDSLAATLAQWRRTAGLRANPISGTVFLGEKHPMAKRKKMPKSLLARFAALRAKSHPRVDIDGVSLLDRRGKRAKHTKRSRAVSAATRAAVRKTLKRKVKHGDVRFNPALLGPGKMSFMRSLKARGAAALAGAKKLGRKALAKRGYVGGRYVALDGTVFAPGKNRMSVIAAVKKATGAKHGHVKWNPVLSHREGVAIMKRAAKLKRAGKRVPTKFVTPRGRVRTLKAAELRMQGKKVNRRGTGKYVTQEGRRIVLRSSSKGSKSGSGGSFNPLAIVGLV